MTTDAFAGAEHSSGTEGAIVDALREAGALSLSLVAVDGAGDVVGHIAFSPVSIAGEDGRAVTDWYGLGPVSVAPEHQSQGVGAALIREGLKRLEAGAAKGCVLLGDPVYYARFGFAGDAGPTYPGPPSEYFQALAFGDNAMPRGVVTYHEGFDAP